jgi:nitrogen fixation-related uncharacterized protein
MSPRVWLILLILSIAVSGEAMLWAISHGQFRDVERGNRLPLRAAESPLNASRRRPVALGFYIGGLVIAGAILAALIAQLLVDALWLRP